MTDEQRKALSKARDEVEAEMSSVILYAQNVTRAEQGLENARRALQDQQARFRGALTNYGQVWAQQMGAPAPEAAGR
jgi:hypothetical protein